MASTQLQVVGQTTILDKSVNVFGTFEEPLFLAKDVAEWIEYSEGNVSHMLQMVDESEKVKIYCAIPDSNNFTKPTESATYGFANRLFLTEDGIYEVLMQSTKPIAKAFKSQVKAYLKELRTKGITATPSTIEAMLNDPDMLINALTQLKEERQQRQLAESKARVAESKAVLMEQINIDNKPKVLFADAVTASKTSILIGELAKIIKQNGVDMGQNRLFEWLRDNGYLMSRKGTDYNMPTQRSMDMSLFEIKETVIAHSDGHTSVNKTPKVTGKGQTYFINKFLGNGTQND